MIADPGLMIADPANARGGVGLCALGLGALFAPGRSERVRRGREVGHCRSHRRSCGCGHGAMWSREMHLILGYSFLALLAF
jgi:hypothetical protein